MRLAAATLGVIGALAMPSLALASPAQQIGKASSAPDLQDAVSELSYGRADGPASQAELYFPAQLLPDGDRLLFTEYNSILRPRYYKLGGALRSVSPAGGVTTLALAKKMSLTADRMTGLAAADGTVYSTLGESIISLPLPGRQASAERTLSLPEHGSIRQAMSALTLGSDELPYDTIAGQAAQVGSADGSGAQARFAYPYALSLDGGSLLVADRDNDAVRRVNLASGQTETVLSAVNAPVALAQAQGRLYVGAARGLWSLPVGCQTGCQAALVEVQGGVSALAQSGGQMAVISPSGIYAYDPATGSLAKVKSSADTSSVGGAAFWSGKLYLTDFARRVIRAYRVEMPEPVKVKVVSQVTPDGTVLSPGLSGTLTYKPSFDWQISAPGCQVTERLSGRMVSCTTPRSARVKLSFSGPAGQGGSVERTLTIR